MNKKTVLAPVGVMLIACTVLLGGCSNNYAERDYLTQTRIPLAQSLEAQEKYAEALIQWKILQTVSPYDESINTQVSRIESIVSNRIAALFAALDKLKDSEDRDKVPKLYLRILALSPGNERAIEGLRVFEWRNALEKAVTKTQAIKNYFVETQTRAKRSIQLSQFIEQGEQFHRDKKYPALLKLADKFEEAFPDNPEPAEYRVIAYSQLAQQNLQKNEKEVAVVLLEKAIQIDKGQTKAQQKRVAELKQQLSKEYLSLGIQAFKKDLDKAIEMFDLSLKYQPSNTAARQQLQRATRVRDNLNKIKRLNASSP